MCSPSCVRTRSPNWVETVACFMAAVWSGEKQVSIRMMRKAKADRPFGSLRCDNFAFLRHNNMALSGQIIRHCADHWHQLPPIRVQSAGHFGGADRFACPSRDHLDCDLISYRCLRWRCHSGRMRLRDCACPHRAAPSNSAHISRLLLWRSALQHLILLADGMHPLVRHHLSQQSRK